MDQTSDPSPSSQYDLRGILRYERIFGEGFVSPGGIETTRRLCSLLWLAPEMRVLDVGSGLGGAALLMAREHGARVTGVDLSPEMVQIAALRVSELSARVRFLREDVREASFEPASFDVVWSRDSLLHVSDKQALFARLAGWLKPGGKLLITDYARGAACSEELEEYVRSSGYHLTTLEAYGRLLEEAGFAGVRVEDRTGEFTSILRREMDGLLAERAAFLRDFSASDLDYLMDRWEKKLRMCVSGGLAWGLFTSDGPTGAGRCP